MRIFRVIYCTWINKNRHPDLQELSSSIIEALSEISQRWRRLMNRSKAKFGKKCVCVFPLSARWLYCDFSHCILLSEHAAGLKQHYALPEHVQLSIIGVQRGFRCCSVLLLASNRTAWRSDVDYFPVTCLRLSFSVSPSSCSLLNIEVQTACFFFLFMTSALAHLPPGVSFLFALFHRPPPSKTSSGSRLALV